MLTWLVSTSLKLRVVVLALSVLLIVLGVYKVRQTPLDVFPEIAEPYVEIQTEAPGLSTEEVESLVTVPLENALYGTPWLKTLRSKSVLGLSSVVLIFEHGTDLKGARQMVQERLATEAPRLPSVAKTPVILQPLSSTSRILKIGMSSKTLSQRDLTILAMWTIRPRLMAIQGVANVAVWGQRDKQFQVLIDPEQLARHGVTLDDVVRAAGDAAVVSAGGFIDTPNQRLAIRQTAPIQTPEDLARSVVAFRDGYPLRLGDVADVTIGSPPPIGDAVINGGPGLLLIVEKLPWGNTLEVTHKIEEALNILKPGLKDVEVDPAIFRPATFIERALKNLSVAMLIGCALVMVILALFLFDWRSALISLTAIPLSLVAAALVLHYWGGTLNTMTLAGLVIALGEVVDDAIIDVENIMRRLRLNRAAANPLPAYQVVLSASLEVRSAVVYASFIVTLVFLPIFFLEGLAGSFFRPLAIAYVLAILASLLVALTITPALSLMFLGRAQLKRADAPLTRLLKRVYGAFLTPILARPACSIGFLLVAFAMTGVATLRLGQEFLPNFKETDFLMHWVEKPGTSLEAMQRVTVLASNDLRNIEGVRNFGAHIGRAEVADEVVGPNFTELWISIEPDVDYDATVAKIQEVVDGYPGLYRDLLTYLKERIKEVLTGASGSIVVRIYGPEMDVLREKGAEVEKAMKAVPGTKNIKLEQQILVAHVEVRPRADALERFGLTAGQVRRSVATAIKGTKVGEVYEGQKKFDVVVMGQPGLRTDVTALRRLLIDLPHNSPSSQGGARGGSVIQKSGGALPVNGATLSASAGVMLVGGQVPLGDVADVLITPTPNEIKRENASRRLDVTCDVEGRDLGSVAREIEAAVGKLSFPREYHPEFLGEYQARQEASWRLFALSALALIGIFLLLYVDFQSLRLALLVFLTIPFALIGGVVAALLTGSVLSLGSLVGFVTVLGIAARNGIMLVSHYRHLELEEGEPFGPALIMRGALERVSPILMTALATGLALLPIVLGGQKPGHEIEYPLAVVILGGLATSTLLNLFILPGLYAMFGRVK